MLDSGDTDTVHTEHDADPGLAHHDAAVRVWTFRTTRQFSWGLLIGSETQECTAL
jgi:hypothetical protein